MRFNISRAKLSLIIVKIDRWFLNHVFNRKRIFTVQLSACVDEYGNTFGKDGNHFFIQALMNAKDFDSYF